MERTFHSGPAVAPDGPFEDPPVIPERKPHTPSPGPAPAEPESIRLLMSGQQITVATLSALLQDIIATDPRTAEFLVEADGCDCVGEALGIRVDLKRGVVLVARAGWDR